MSTTEIIEWIKRNISQLAVDEQFDKWKEAVEFLDSIKGDHKDKNDG